MEEVYHSFHIHSLKIDKNQKSCSNRLLTFLRQMNVVEKYIHNFQRMGRVNYTTYYSVRQSYMYKKTIHWIED